MRIEVTGSRIARIDGETALPVQVIRRDEIERGNWTTAAELMAHVSANFNGTNNALNIGNPFTPGLSSANLRGLGNGNTLVLLNGRRIANYAIAAATVDLTTIPLAAIERVEILKDGASSIYGTDAIAGVVNFITRKNFAGAEVTGQAGVTEQGGGNHSQATVTVGWGDLTKDRFNAFVTVDWQKDTALAASERPFAASGYRPDDGFVSLQRATFPANVRRPNGSLRNPSFADGCLPPLSIPYTTSCAYDYANGYDLLPEQQQWNVIGRATWEWTPGQQVFAEYVYSRNELDARSAPSPAARPQTIDRHADPVSGRRALLSDTVRRRQRPLRPARSLLSPRSARRARRHHDHRGTTRRRGRAGHVRRMELRRRVYAQLQHGGLRVHRRLRGRSGTARRDGDRARQSVRRHRGGRPCDPAVRAGKRQHAQGDRNARPGRLQPVPRPHDVARRTAGDRRRAPRVGTNA